MTVLFVLVPLALLAASGAVMAFVWATYDGQLDDLDTPALRVLQEDEGNRSSALAEEGHLQRTTHEASASGRKART